MTRIPILFASSLALMAAAGQPAPALAQDGSGIAAEIAAMRAEMSRMAARIDSLEAELAATEAQAEAATELAGQAVSAATAAEAGSAPPTDIVFKGAPQIEGENGWSFKPRGRLQYDAGFVNAPDSTGVSDGFGNEARRARLGVSGDMPGGFGYKFEIDFAGSDVTVTDALIGYETGDVEFTVGQFNNFQSLEELTSSLHTTMIERAAFTDAFGFERRVGVAAEYGGENVLVQAGLFTDNMDDLSNRNWSADGRVVVNPKLGGDDTVLHLGGSIHYADLQSGETVRYRQRPLVHFTSTRFINTGNLDASSEFGLGVEGAVIAGPFHAAAEGFWQQVNRPGALTDPTFFGAYAEVGYFLTAGDTRGYKGGKFDRVKPTSPVGEGGAGSVQVNLRYDHLDLNDAGVIGGTQDGYFLSLIWKPTDYTALLANYGRLQYDDAVIPAVGGDTSYGVDSFGVRAQVDF